jgi:hypothetical protein
MAHLLDADAGTLHRASRRIAHDDPARGGAVAGDSLAEVGGGLRVSHARVGGARAGCRRGSLKEEAAIHGSYSQGQYAGPGVGIAGGVRPRAGRSPFAAESGHGLFI